MVELEVGGKTYTSSTVESYSPSWNTDLATGLSESSLTTFEVWVYDEDSLSNWDVVGGCTLTWNASWPGTGPMTFTCPGNPSNADQTGYQVTLSFTRNP